MAHRSTMDYLITELAGRVDAGTATYQEQHGSGLFFDSRKLQDVLDRHRVDIWRQSISAQVTYSGSTPQYKEYLTKIPWLEQTSGGTAVFFIQDTTSTIGTANYSVDYQRGHITFTADQAGSVRYLTARSYDMDGAAAEAWRMKASWYATDYSFSTDNHRVDKGAVINNCIKMAEFYESRSIRGGFNVTTMYRSDTIPC